MHELDAVSSRARRGRMHVRAAIGSEHRREVSREHALTKGRRPAVDAEEQGQAPSRIAGGGRTTSISTLTGLRTSREILAAPGSMVRPTIRKPRGSSQDSVG